MVDFHPGENSGASLPGGQGVFNLPRWMRNRLGYLVLGLLGLNLIFTLWVGFDWLPDFDRTTLSTLFYDGMGLLALIFGILVARQAAQPVAIRRAWLVLALAYALNSAADIIYTYLTFRVYGDGNVPFPSQADIFYLGFYLLALVGIFLLPGESASRAGKTILVLDLGIVSLSAGLFLWYFLIFPSLQLAEADPVSQLLAVLYPLADLLLLIGVLYLVRRQPRQVHPYSLSLLLVSFLFFLAADAAYVFQALSEGFAYGSLVDAGYTWSFWFFMLASLRQYGAGSEADRGAVSPPRSLTWLSENLSILAALGGFILSAYGLVLRPLPALPAASLVLPALIIAILLVIQLSIRVRENAQLAHNLEQILGELRVSRQAAVNALERNRRDLRLALQLRQILQRERNLEHMLQQAVDLIRETFGLYYVQIYLTEAGILKLKAGSGETGQKLVFQGHSLLIGPGSINGRAAAEKKAVVVENTEKSPIFRANPLLPETRSEMAVPVLAGERLLGVLDLQSSEVGALSEDVLPVAEILASELATAMENIQLVNRYEQVQAEYEARAKRNVQQAWEEFLDAIERGERLGYVVKPAAEKSGFELHPLSEVSSAEAGLPDYPRLSVPIEVAGGQIGVIELVRPVEEGRSFASWSADDLELVQAVSARLARQVENLRLLAQAERFRRQVQEADQRQLQEAWLALLTGESRHAGDHSERGFIYDAVQVQPLAGNGDLAPAAAHIEPVQIRGQMIGELIIAEGPALGADQLELVQTVAERLGEHLEALRLSAQTEKALADTEALYAASEQVVRAQTMQDAVRSLVHSTALQRYQQVGVLLFDRPWASARSAVAAMSAAAARSAAAVMGAAVQPTESGQWVGTWSKDGTATFVQLGKTVDLQQQPYLRLLSRDRPLIIENVDADERLDAPIRYALRQLGSTVAFFPLVAADQWIGVLVAGSDTEVLLSEADLRQIQSLIGQAATVMQTLRLLQESQARAQREQLLRQVGERVRAAVEPELVLRAAVREVGEALGRSVLVRLTPPREAGPEEPATAPDFVE